MSLNNFDIQVSCEEDQEEQKLQGNKLQPLDSAQFDELILNKEFDKLSQIAEKNHSLKEYPKLKYQGKFYSVGDNVLLIQTKTPLKVELVAKIKRIISVLTTIDQIEIPLIQVNWYCDRSNISPHYNEYQSCFSMNELFLTEQESTLFVDRIISPSVVMTYENYEKNIESAEDRLFFTRANYNTKTQKFNPPPNEWQKICICNMPTNPELAYIFCEICNKWLHMACVKITDDQASKIDKYICPKCKKK